ncbi:MAG: hypothetical protein JWL74_768 [Alphaproteobacteria bacterium]|jgi:hypothetical protein|nr:hypothetical protein [Alphaproteobacteria bacterium]
MKKSVLSIALLGSLSLAGCTAYGNDPLGSVLGSVLGSGYNSGYNQGGYYGQGGQSFQEAAVEGCANQAQRYGQVRVTNVQQVRNDTLRVNGSVAVNGGWQQRGFYCDFRADGRITGFDIQ